MMIKHLVHFNISFLFSVYLLTVISEKITRRPYKQSFFSLWLPSGTTGGSCRCIKTKEQTRGNGRNVAFIRRHQRLRLRGELLTPFITCWTADRMCRFPLCCTETRWHFNIMVPVMRSSVRRSSRQWCQEVSLGLLLKIWVWLGFLPSR